jgi:hypothetical protein
MIKLRQFFGINHGDDRKDFIILQVMEVSQQNMADNVVGKGKLEGGFVVLEGVDSVKLIDDIGNKIGRKEPVVRVVDFGHFDDCLFGECVEAGRLEEQGLKRLLELKGEVHK